jgi:hypothetical protein
VSNWFFGVIAEVAYRLAFLHKRRAAHFVARAKAANEAAERCSLVQQWADGDEPWPMVRARDERRRRNRAPFVATVLEGPQP